MYRRLASASLPSYVLIGFCSTSRPPSYLAYSTTFTTRPRPDERTNDFLGHAARPLGFAVVGHLGSPCQMLRQTGDVGAGGCQVLGVRVFHEPTVAPAAIENGPYRRSRERATSETTPRTNQTAAKVNGTAANLATNRP